MKFLKKVSFIFILILLLVLLPSRVKAEDASSSSVLGLTPTPSLTSAPSQNNQSEKLNDLQNQIKELQNKVSELQSQGKTLSSQIGVMDGQIKLTELKINATRQELNELVKDIETANNKIKALEQTLSNVTKVLFKRISATYEVASFNKPLNLFLSSNSISSFFSRSNYLRIVQAHDKQVIFATQQAKNDYANQKDIYEDKKAKVESLKKQLEGYTAQLDQEKKSKQALLEATKNDEKKYQDLLARARAEFEAIQGIVAGKGTETEAGSVSEGGRIATVISGSSCNSDGSHLHFIVARGGSTENPFNYLRGGVDYENCSGSSCGSGDADSFNPGGSWNWPLDPKIKMNQGYGSTWATRNTWVGRVYNFHNGIDIQGSSSDVKAVRSGKLYQGSYSGYAGCRLRYVKVVHDDGLETLYLHVNYIL